MNVNQMNQMLVTTKMITVDVTAKSPAVLDDIDEISEFVWDSVRKEISMNEDHEAMALYFSENQMTIVRMGRLFVSENGKNLAAITMRNFVEELKPKFFVFVTSAYVAFAEAKTSEAADAKMKEVQQYKSIRDVPGSMETVAVSIETHNAVRSELAIIERHKDGKLASLTRRKDLDNVGGAGGRFAGVLANTFN